LNPGCSHAGDAGVEPGDFDPLATQRPKALTETAAAAAEQPFPLDHPSSTQVDEDDEDGGRVRDLNNP
jgi:hypothetical protein